MSTTYNDGSFTTARKNGRGIVTRPLYGDGDPAHQVIYDPFVVDKSNYSTTALDTAHPTISGAYLVAEEGHADFGNDLMSFTRVYATIPATRRRYTGTESYQFPRLPTQPAATAQTVTGGTFSGGDTLRLAIVSSGVSVGDVIYYAVRLSKGGVTWTDAGYATAITGTDASGINIRFRYSGTAPTFITSGFSPFIIGDVFLGRAAFTQVVSTVTEYEYFLPGVTTGITQPEDVQPLQPWAPIDRTTGNVTVNLTGSDATDYISLLKAGGYLILSSTVENYLGNILVRETRYVKAL